MTFHLHWHFFKAWESRSGAGVSQDVVRGWEARGRGAVGLDLAGWGRAGADILQAYF